MILEGNFWQVRATAWSASP